MWAVPGGLLAEVPRAKVRGVEVRGVVVESLGDGQTDGWIITDTHTKVNKAQLQLLDAQCLWISYICK